MILNSFSRLHEHTTAVCYSVAPCWYALATVSTASAVKNNCVSSFRTFYS